jgi:GTP pyrophosphokinase
VEAAQGAYIARLASASKSGLLVSACDKLHNARSILGDYREVGEALWSRFTGGKEGTLWYNALIEAYRKAKAPVAPPKALIDELGRTFGELERLVGVAGM